MPFNTPPSPFEQGPEAALPAEIDRTMEEAMELFGDALLEAGSQQLDSTVYEMTQGQLNENPLGDRYKGVRVAFMDAHPSAQNPDGGCLLHVIFTHRNDIGDMITLADTTEVTSEQPGLQQEIILKLGFNDSSAVGSSMFWPELPDPEDGEIDIADIDVSSLESNLEAVARAMEADESDVEAGPAVYDTVVPVPVSSADIKNVNDALACIQATDPTLALRKQ